MFGENIMIGNEQRSVDNKSRVILPDFCDAKKNDIVVIISKEDYIEIWSLETFCKIMEKMKVDEFTYDDKLTAFIPFKNVKVDVSKRINLTSKLVDKYQLQEGAHIEGKGAYIRIWNIGRFEDYKNNLEEVNYSHILTPKKD